MAEPQDAVTVILRKIQGDVGATRRGMKAMPAKMNDIAENLMDARSDIADGRRDMLMHLGLTTKHRADFESLREEVVDLKTRLDALEVRS